MVETFAEGKPIQFLFMNIDQIQGILSRSSMALARLQAIGFPIGEKEKNLTSKELQTNRKSRLRLTKVIYPKFEWKNVKHSLF